MKVPGRLLLAAATFGVVAYLPTVAGNGASGAASDLGLGRLLAEGSLLAFGAAFAGGILTSLTPCVYPLIPITVSIFGARQAASRRHAIAQSGLYVLGIAAMYSALGAGAALTGKAFGGAMQNPWVIGGVALFFAAMAASMFGAFEIRLPSGVQARLATVGGAGHAGAFVMGLVAGIVAAPCTGPVLAAALTYVATRGSIAFGLGIMFTYALGIGLLFFLIGAFSISLPKSGVWMETVKAIFGIALLAAAGVFLLNAIPAVKPIFSAARWAALAAAGAAALGVILGALADPRGASLARAAKAIGIALVAGGIVYSVGAADARGRAASASLDWLHDEPAALSFAKSEGKPVLIDFWADWCAACKELDRTAWSDPRVRDEAKRFVKVKIDATADSPAVAAAFDKYQVVGMPTVIFIDSHGREMPARITSALSAEEMRKWLSAVDHVCAQPVVACAVRW